MRLGSRQGWVAALVLLLIVGSRADSQAPPGNTPAQGGDVTVRDSPNSIIGQRVNIDVLNADTVIFQAAQRDLLTQQFVATLQEYQRSNSEALRKLHDSSTHVAIYDSPDPSRPTFYTFLAGTGVRDDSSSGAEVCEVQPGIRVWGLVSDGSREAGTSQIKLRVMSRAEKSLLHAICRGLGSPLSMLSEAADGDRVGGATIYDFLSRDSGSLTLLLYPAQILENDLELGASRRYWAPALVSRYYRTGVDINQDPALFNQYRGFQQGGSMTVRGELPAAADSGGFPKPAIDEFGLHLVRLDRDWMSYLERSIVTIRGRQLPLIRDGQPARVVPRFPLAQVQSRAFWQSVLDWRALSEQMNCIAGQFLADRQYVPPGEIVNFGRCALAEVRRPSD
jgi:hypothetical protein